MDINASTYDVENCHHCGLEAYYPVFYNHKTFCCNGCSQVYQILSQHHLEDYYQIKAKGVKFTDSTPVESTTKEEFLYLDQPEFFQKYGRETSNHQKEFSFYVEGIHCVACLWLLEKLPQLNSYILSSHFDLSLSKLTVIYQDVALSQIASLISHLGYKCYPLKGEEERKQHEKIENRRELIRLAVSGMCAGNIMLFAIALYGGATGEWEKYFQWASLLLAIPPLTYGAMPFYRNFLRDLKLKKVSLDTPIVISLIIGMVIGTWNLLRGNPEIYFDTLAILVFLLLFSRHVLRLVQQKGLQLNHLTDYFTQSWARKFDHELKEYLNVDIEQLRVGDRVKILAGELVPVDGKVLFGNAYVNTSLITGEFAPQLFKPGDKIYSGTQVQDKILEVQTEATGAETRVGKILEEIKSSWLQKNHLIRFSDQLARYLITFVLTTAFFMFLYLAPTNLEMALSRTLALIIITCPCALGLATPLAMVLGLKAAAKNGIIIKSDEALEKASKVKNIFLDKTGTLTHGRFQVTHWQGETEEIRSIVYEMEKISKHPIATALVQYIESKGRSKVSLSKQKEIIGIGIEAEFQGKMWKIKSIPISEGQKPDVYQSKIGIFCENELTGQITLEDTLRFEVPEILREFQKRSIPVKVISGDGQKAVLHIGKQLGLSDSDLHYQVTPEQKQQLLQSSVKAMMVGDGANDALALTHAYLGVAVKGSVNMSLKVADVYLTKPGITGILNLIQIAQETMAIVKRNVVFSLLYNVVGISAACLGYVTPLWAAIFMPLSSLTVVLSTIWGTKILREVRA